MLDQLLNLKKLRLNYKVTLVAVILLVLLTLFLTQKKIFFLLTATGISIVTSLLIGLFGPLKVVGIESVTFSTILIGSLFGSLIGAISGVSLLIIHFILARYQGGPYLVWVVPGYALIGVLSGILTDVRMLVAMVVGINILDNILTLTFYRENYIKTLVFSIGNTIFNSILLLKLFETVTALIV